MLTQCRCLLNTSSSLSLPRAPILATITLCGLEGSSWRTNNKSNLLLLCLKLQCEFHLWSAQFETRHRIKKNKTRTNKAYWFAEVYHELNISYFLAIFTLYAQLLENLKHFFTWSQCFNHRFFYPALSSTCNFCLQSYIGIYGGKL